MSVNSTKYIHKNGKKPNDYFITPEYYNPGVNEDFLVEAFHLGFKNMNSAIRKASEIEHAREQEAEAIEIIKRSGYYV